MSEQPNPGAFVDSAFASLMDTMVEDDAPEEGSAPAAPEGGQAGAGYPPAGGDAGAAGAAGAPAAAEPAATPGGAGAPGVGDAAPADGGGAGGAEGADDGPGAGDRAPAWTVDVATVTPDLGGLSQKFEENVTAAFQQQALQGIQTEYKPYFDALSQHPRMLVGREVPALNGEDGAMETLRDADDAREWQEAVKQLLTDEVRERATVSMESNADILSTVHQSIELFAMNKDLVPGTRQFDRVLADRFAAMASPYELRIEGKLHGYTIPVQPIIDQLRAQLGRERAAAPAAAAAPPAAQRGRPRKAADPPQAGIPSKAGSAGGEEEDFSTLFGTLGLPNFRI